MPNKQIRHGNYSRYYEFRNEDSRSEHFKEALPGCLNELHHIDQQTKDLHLLDIGSNIGKLTASTHAAIQEKLSETGKTAHALGVDIDKELIEEATKTYGGSTVEFAQADISAIALEQTTENPMKDYLARNEIERFDFVSCFSTLMYIHLNHGDDGLKKVLDHLCSLANILELHPWSKYRDQVKKMRKEGDGDYELFDKLCWKEDQLEKKISDYVVDQGFKVVCEQEKRNERNRNITFFAKNNKCE